MKLLLDEGFSPRLAKVLARGGHDAVSVYEVGVSGATDAEVFRFAVQQKRSLLTMETGFQLHLYPPGTVPGMSMVTPYSYTEGAIEEMLVTSYFLLRHLVRRKGQR